MPGGAERKVLHGDATRPRYCACLKKVDAVLVEAQAIAGNAREATNDLGTLRAEVVDADRKVTHL